MLAKQQHRGPDAQGVYSNEDVTLAHNRLSIIDLSPKANQPFHSKDGRYVMVFNGEIYNYKELKEDLKDAYEFRTNSDTEVLLACYSIHKEGCLQKLNGMFAFAIWDTVKRELFAARDRFGVKPFYYHFNDSVLTFASEIKTLFEYGIPKKPSPKSWINYFVSGSYAEIDTTFWEDIYQLPAGHYMKKSEENILIRKWYHFEKEVNLLSTNDISYEEAKIHYLNLLNESVQLRFRSDVPLGFNVSGGLDSSTLLMLVNTMDNGQNINAFSFYTNHPDYDELPWVEKMISITKNPLEKVLLSAEEVESSIRKISYHQDEPYGGIPTIAYSNIFRCARQKGIKVLLDGQGIDEQLAGYDYYRNKSSSTIQGVKGSPFRSNVIASELQELAVKTQYPKYFSNPLLNLQYRDLFCTKIPRALRFNDRVSMAYSTELREPFLDYRLVEFGFSLPESYKIGNGKGKRILRDLVAKELSDTISYAPKRPLQTPQREWLANELKPIVNQSIDVILGSKYSNWFNKSELDKEWRLYQDGNQDSSFHIWQWINFSLLIN